MLSATANKSTNCLCIICFQCTFFLQDQCNILQLSFTHAIVNKRTFAKKISKWRKYISATIFCFNILATLQAWRLLCSQTLTGCRLVCSRPGPQPGGGRRGWARPEFTSNLLPKMVSSPPPDQPETDRRHGHWDGSFGVNYHGISVKGRKMCVGAVFKKRAVDGIPSKWSCQEQIHVKSGLSPVSLQTSNPKILKS